jgi:hypothetical protein
MVDGKELWMRMFNKFWSIYPKKVKKKDALKIWLKLSFNTANLILQDIPNRIARDARWKNGYVPDPTTYLRGERWNDEIVKAPGKTQDKRPAAHDLYVEPDWMKR